MMALEFPLEFQAVFAALMGLALGSFLNVVIVRLPRGRSIVRPSSRCGNCRSALSAFQNLPILSFLFSRGRCRRCGVPYSARYLWTEILASVISLAVWSIYGWQISTILLGLFALSLLAISLIDLELKIVPDELSVGGWMCALAIALLAPKNYPIDFWGALLGGVVGYVFFWLMAKGYAFVRKEEGLGGGDVKLMGFVGSVLGIQGVFTTVLVGAFTGSLVGLIFMCFFRRTKHFPIPFAPFLAMGAFVSLFQLDRWIWP